MEFRPIRTKRIHEEIVEQIIGMIAQGTLKPGDRLLPERELAEMLGVSRASVREALSALAVLGVVEVRRGEGTFIKKTVEREFLHPFGLLLLLDTTLEVLEIRKILEVEGVALAAKRAAAEDLRSIRRALEEMEAEVEAGGLGDEGDYLFHFRVAQATQNSILVKMINGIMDVFKVSLKVSRERLFKLPGAVDILLKQHWAIYEAIAQRDAPAAQAAMRTHLEWVEEKILELQAEGGGVRAGEVGEAPEAR